jgi:flavin-dependent dehydrogenase
VERHILMSGDTAGMIAPLCGNGMTMAIHSAKILSSNICRHYQGPAKFSIYQRQRLETDYTEEWDAHFARRLWVGRQLQRMFGQNYTTAITLQLLNALPKVADFLISKTHGKPFD